MVIETHGHDHDFRLKRLQSLVDLQLTPNTTTYLQGEIKAAEEELRLITANNEVLLKAKEEAEKLAKAADEAKQGATVLAMRSEQLNTISEPFGEAPLAPLSPVPLPAPIVAEVSPEEAEIQIQSELAQQKSLKAAEAADKARQVFEQLTTETEMLQEKLDLDRLIRLKSY